jgi:hypothetical protein
MGPKATIFLTLSLLLLAAGLPLAAQAQTLAGLHSVSILPAALQEPLPPRAFSENPSRCITFPRPLSVASRESSVVDEISSRLAGTPLFVKNYPAVSGRCPDRAPARIAAPLDLAPANFCMPAGPLGLSPVCRLQGGIVNFRTWDIARTPANESANISRPERESERFHWGPALVQSVEFLLFEHAFRLADDPYLRYLLAHKPFWHDWLVSAGQFDMSRWGDGDDFLVNYIGHPMQGGVTGNIYVQNDPRSRALKFGQSKAYWQSRMRAMMWSAVYSAYFEIGPVLSEVAVGNEGGYTYTPGCGHYVCDRPGYKPPTNNTGWVDFIITPTMGTGLMILEDAIDTKIVDRLAKNDPRFGFKVLRSMLSPTHSMANMLAGRYPWFRFSDESSRPGEEFGSGFLPGAGPDMRSRNQLWKYEPRWSAGLHYTNINLPMDWPGCPACRLHSSGVGTNLGYRLSNLVSFDSEFNVFPGAGSQNGKARAEEFLAGVKVGRTVGSWGLFTTLRPGFIHYDKTLVPASQTEYESANRFVLDAGGVAEYHASSRSIIRFDLGVTFVRYLTGHPDPRQLPQTVLSPDYITTQGNFHLGSGYVFRF